MTPAIQPTPVAQVVAALGAPAFNKYICHACGYIYDEAEGDPDSGLAAGTRFEDIPEDWACPLCGVTKSDFEPYSAPSLDELRARAGGADIRPRRNAAASPRLDLGRLGSVRS